FARFGTGAQARPRAPARSPRAGEARRRVRPDETLLMAVAREASRTLFVRALCERRGWAACAPERPRRRFRPGEAHFPPTEPIGHPVSPLHPHLRSPRDVFH